MHPIERLRYLARSSGADPRLMVSETASALRGMGVEPAGLVVACRRIVERHPTSGPLWWLCAHMLTATDPYSTARLLADEIDGDVTPDVLIDEIPADATVCVVGWPDLAGEAILRRGDIRVFAIDADDQGAAFARRLERSDVEAEVIDPGGLAAAVLAADLVLIEVLAASGSEIIAARGSRAAASVAYCSEVPIWAVSGVGRCLPDAGFLSLVERLGDVRAPWLAEADVVPLALFSHLASAAGVVKLEDASFGAECPLAHELLHTPIN
ncbi:MAG TPA: hypothetical protein PK020_08180 [Ilumatobacteraceae bacterium]|nr:hypothetical protein [Ilumatobacteraceae bacterium]HRB01943.1 hypothetical protein [Ilumatobacteraceae bacterium]